jgi:uncharacterized membrane protein
MRKGRLEAFSDSVLAIYVIVAVMWLIPERRIENRLRS